MNRSQRRRSRRCRKTTCGDLCRFLNSLLTESAFIMYDWQFNRQKKCIEWKSESKSIARNARTPRTNRFDFFDWIRTCSHSSFVYQIFLLFPFEITMCFHRFSYSSKTFIFQSKKFLDSFLFFILSLRHQWHSVNIWVFLFILWHEEDTRREYRR